MFFFISQLYILSAFSFYRYQYAIAENSPDTFDLWALGFDNDLVTVYRQQRVSTRAQLWNMYELIRDNPFPRRTVFDLAGPQRCPNCVHWRGSPHIFVPGYGHIPAPLEEVHQTFFGVALAFISWAIRSNLFGVPIFSTSVSFYHALYLLQQAFRKDVVEHGWGASRHVILELRVPRRLIALAGPDIFNASILAPAIRRIGRDPLRRVAGVPAGPREGSMVRGRGRTQVDCPNAGITIPQPVIQAINSCIEYGGRFELCRSFFERLRKLGRTGRSRLAIKKKYLKARIDSSIERRGYFQDGSGTFHRTFIGNMGSWHVGFHRGGLPGREPFLQGAYRVRVLKPPRAFRQWSRGYTPSMAENRMGTLFSELPGSYDHTTAGTGNRVHLRHQEGLRPECRATLENWQQ